MLNPAILSHPSEFLTQWAAHPNPRQSTAEVFLADQKKRYALGRNENTLLLAKDIQLSGVVDDFITEPMEWHGLPVVSQHALPADAILVNTVANARPITAQQNVQRRGDGLWLDHSDLYQIYPDLFTPPEYVQQSRATLQEKSEHFDYLYQKLADDESRKTLLDIFHYRMTGSPSFMHGYTCRVNDQYFESFFDFPQDGSFVDAGGFHGETSLEFSSRYPAYSDIHVFEPSASNYERVLDALKNTRNTNAYRVGLSSKKEVLRFSGDNGSASKISDSGTDSIEVDRLDSFNLSRVDFIKMDLEGWELHALNGAQATILKNHPILAISGYHHPQDFIQIYDFVTQLRKDYKIYLRHYTEGWTESVLYFVPINVTKI
jgi:FkbM family methyltransferase